ncbi:hypothetical protein [Egbenema bharatensis]|uniref:hypothetical protein n=1 Tax=Egbenema bharatensis TaxID=3463334 RepID=UPI003A85D135
MFTPTHYLVSRSRKTPVQLIPSANGFHVLTEPEWQQGKEAAFEMRARQGFFCQGIPVVGYHLQPIELAATTETAKPTEVAETHNG